MRRKWILIATMLCLVIFMTSNKLRMLYIRVFHRTVTVTKYDVNGKADGEAQLYENGILKTKGRFVHGMKEGWVCQYYTNGSLESKISYKQDVAIGSGYDFYEDGGIKTYYAYDKAMVITKVEGFPISDNIYSTDIKSGKKVLLNNSKNQTDHYSGLTDLYVTVATPPTCHLNVKVIVNDKVWKRVYVSKNTLKVENVFANKQRYSILLISHLLDKDTKHLCTKSAEV